MISKIFFVSNFGVMMACSGNSELSELLINVNEVHVALIKLHEEFAKCSLNVIVEIYCFFLKTCIYFDNIECNFFFE